MNDPPTLLVVDDDDRNRKLLDALLTPEGYRVIETHDGRSAVDRVVAGDVDLVLLDVMMPNVDGFETCARIRERSRTYVPVVFITALRDRASRVRGKEVGADDFLSKPIDDVELLVRIKRLLEAKQLFDQRERQREYLEQELERRTEQLLRAERLATLGTLAGGVGHELNNLTAVFMSYLRFVRDRTEAGQVPELRDLDTLAAVTEQLRNHARSLLSLGRPQPDRVRRVDLAEVIRETVTVFSRLGKLKRIELELAISDRPTWVDANPQRLEQVLTNLLHNAADALHERSVPPRRLTVTLDDDPSEPTVRIEVADNAQGMDADRLARAFEPYFTTKPPERGTGLGLAVVRQIVESYRGTVRLLSTPGEGTRAIVELPHAQSDT